MLYLWEYILSRSKASNVLQFVERFCSQYFDNIGSECAVRDLLAVFLSRSVAYGVVVEEESLRSYAMDFEWNPALFFSTGPSGGVQVLSHHTTDGVNSNYDCESLSVMLGGSLGISQSLTEDAGLSDLSSMYLRLSNRCITLAEILVRYDNAQAMGTTSHERVLSTSVFLVVLKEFVLASDYTSIFEPRVSPEVIDVESERSICGMVLLILQEKIPFDLLLRDGLHIFLLLETFITSRANVLASAKTSGMDFSSNTFAFDFGDNSLSDNFEGPLISEVSDSIPVSISSDRKGNISSENAAKSSEDVGDASIIGNALAMLSAILTFGTEKRTEAEEKVLRRLFEPLQILSTMEVDTEIAQAAADVALALLTRSATPEHVHKVSNETLSRTDVTAFQLATDEARNLIKDESPAMRGLGVRKIIIALREPEEPLSKSDRELARVLLIGLLKDPESFVYLNVVHALGRLADICRAEIVPILLDEYSEVGEERQQLSVHERSVLSEALMIILRRAGDAAPSYVPNYVCACIRVIKNETSVLRDASTLENHEIEQRNLLRQSALSLLAEACALAGWSAKHMLRDVIDIAGGILSLENPAISSTKFQQQSRYGNLKFGVHSGRRSAAFLVRYVLAGIRHKKFTISAADQFLPEIGSILRTIDSYDTRTVNVEGNLKEIREDEVVLFHCRRALGILEQILPPLTRTYSIRSGKEWI